MVSTVVDRPSSIKVRKEKAMELLVLLVFVIVAIGQST